ncbi:hypothetical protein H6P81_013351 [Aristolochia fimbriata]|uniref:Aminotransferase class I/classII large domain-containing protein n=1 Tax=Aristolochia fimbriata TaxID=158543 RepID=A0AAV7EEQ9_ARIFI|nr:hypothetical protein H6P81_013351 [Aristolochia fimbriata]
MQWLKDQVLHLTQRITSQGATSQGLCNDDSEDDSDLSIRFPNACASWGQASEHQFNGFSCHSSFVVVHDTQLTSDVTEFCGIPRPKLVCYLLDCYACCGVCAAFYLLEELEAEAKEAEDADDGDENASMPEAIQEKRVATVQCLSGTESLRVGAEFLAKHYHKHTIYIPQPTWGNHPEVFTLARLTVKYYRYYDPATRGLNFQGLLEHLVSAPPGAIVLLHACAHNPTSCIVHLAQCLAISFWSLFTFSRFCLT